VQLIDDLRAEHRHIEDMLGALRTYARVRDGDPADGARFLAFFRLYADRFHHAREEDVLFTALADELSVPRERGPIAVLSGDHGRMRAILGELAADLHNEPLAIAYSRALWVHIDNENSVLFPESEARLLRAGVRELPARAMREDESRALDEALPLLAKYPRTIDTHVVRGDGCVVCPAFGESCDGLEREWWSENEWEEFPDRVG